MGYTNLFRSPYSHVKKKKKVAKLKWYFFIKILKRKSPLQMREYGRTRILVFNGLLTFWSLPVVKSSHWLAELCYHLVEPFWDLSVESTALGTYGRRLLIVIKDFRNKA